MNHTEKQTVLDALDTVLSASPKRQSAWEKSASEALALARTWIDNAVTTREAGLKGGASVFSKHGAEFFRTIGKQGGNATKERHGEKHYAAIGKAGGNSVKERLGHSHYEAIGKKGGNRVRELIQLAKSIENDKT
ncbi:MAG TPA: hypothetical protein VFH72_05025 [Candidatus Baltobacteraceae bacterium]|nr:hypothetical protein [Candidatus Baltobacteraceae bacterium]